MSVTVLSCYSLALPLVDCPMLVLQRGRRRDEHNATEARAHGEAGGSSLDSSLDSCEAGAGLICLVIR